MRRTEAEFHRVKQLLSHGLSDSKVAELTGVPRATVLRWRRRHEAPTAVLPAIAAANWQISDAPAYCYLLGTYLGDGHVTHKPPRSWTLRIACDRRYPGIIDEIRRAMERTFPGRSSTQIPASAGQSDVVAVRHPAIGRAFPQHGSGRKHLRKIHLAEWQTKLTHAHPGSLIRGLIHSDGCRVINHFKKKLPSGRIGDYSYVRYFFTNYSEDIRRIFFEHCELLGIRVTQSNHPNLTVSHRHSVAILEELVGPKQ